MLPSWTIRTGRTGGTPALPRGGPSGRCEGRDALHVMRHRERVEGAQAGQLPAKLAEDRDVAGEGGRVTGDVRHPPQAAAARTGRPQQPLDDRPAHPGPGWVEYGESGL